MKPLKIFLIINSFFLGFLFLSLSIPLVKEKVPQNSSYGFRTEKTLANEDVWYKANKYMGKELFKAGLVTIAMSVILLVFVKKMSMWNLFAVESLILAAIIIALILRAISYLKGI